MYCSQEVLKQEHSLIGSIEHRAHQLFIEVPEPWNKVFSLSEHFPPKLLNVLQFFSKNFASTSTSVFAPDSEYSDSKGLRLIYLQHHPDSYSQSEFVIPRDEIAEALHDLLIGKTPKKYAVKSHHRDIFVCVHTQRDKCCGVFGRELYEKLRADQDIQKSNVRIFASSHIGGHRYAPTILESPTLNCWGQLNFEIARQIILRQGDVEAVLPHYRGSAHLSSGFFQAAERELIRHYGWDSFAFHDKHFIADVKEDTAQVRVNFVNKDSIPEQFRVKVSKSAPVHLRANCDEDKVSGFPQYQVV